MHFDPNVLIHGDLKDLIQTVGYIGVFSIVFIESGLLVGFFFPGDSLLFTAGFLASQGFFNIAVLIIGCFIAAVLGDSTGFFIGSKWGRKMFKKEESTLFKKSHLVKAHDFYIKHGGKTIMLARFMPLIRTFAPVVAGMAEMKYTTFLFYNIFGGALWAIGVTLTGYYLGSLIPGVDKYLLPIIFVIIFLSVLPGLFHILKEEETRAALVRKILRK
jgi:membrane-associated protein